MATLTGPQFEVIALLAAGKDVNQIATITGGDQASANGHIRDACLALGANDRTHLMAVAYQAGLLHMPTLAAARAEAEQYHAEMVRANEAATTARNAQTLLERKLTTARNDLAAETERRQHAERRAETAAAPGEVAQLHAQLETARRAVDDARNGKALAERQAEAARQAMSAEVDKRKTAEAKLATAKQRASASDPALRRQLAQAQAAAAAQQQRADGLQVRVDRHEAGGTPPRTAVDARDPGGTTVQWVVDRLQARARQARDLAARSGRHGMGADLASARLAGDLEDIASALAAQWQRAQARTPVGAR